MKRINGTIIFEKPPCFVSYAAVGSKKEGEGPLAKKFDLILNNSNCEQKTWEKAESVMVKKCLQSAMLKANITTENLDAVIGGDLQNQCTATHFAMRDFDVPLIGIYGACSTMAQSIGISAIMAQSGAMQTVAAISSSHFCAAERQYRTPLVYGAKRAPTAQWTVTGAGCAIIKGQSDEKTAQIKGVTFGKVLDFGVKDITNMGAAMAPAAAQTIMRHLNNTGNDPLHYDAIYTGDLGHIGRILLLKILKREGIILRNHKDCGLIIYDRQKQDVMAGASGAACSATVLCADILPKFKSGKLKRVLFCSTGALMSQATFLQKESIPVTAHLVEISAVNTE